MLPARGRGIHSPVYVDDLVEGIVRAAQAPAAAGRVITLSGGVGVETREYFGHCGRMVGRKVPAVPTAVALAGAAAMDRLARLRGSPNELDPRRRPLPGRCAAAPTGSAPPASCSTGRRRSASRRGWRAARSGCAGEGLLG